MATLTALGSGHGFTAGDLDATGQVAVCQAYQKIYVADGRPHDDSIALSGYHKIDCINDRIESDATNPGWVKGAVLTQDQGGGVTATAIFDETVDRGSGVYWHLMYRTTGVPFVTGVAITDGAVVLPLANVTGVAYPPHWLNWNLTVGDFPDGGSDVLALAFGRIFMNAKSHPHQWFATRINDPLDMLLVTDDVASAANGQSAEKAGLVGDTLIVFIPHKDVFTIFGCANKMFVMRGDPNRNGFFSTLCDNTGIFSNTSFCWDDKFNLYWVGNDGIYVISYDAMLNGGTASNLTKDRVPKLISSMGLNRGTDRIAMVYDKDRYGIHITVSQKDGGWHTALWLDLRTNGIFPEKYAGGQIPTSAMYFDSKFAAERTCLVGCFDGYVRKWSEDAKSDIAANDSSVAIDSYVTVGPVSAQNPRGKIKLSELSVRTGIDSDRLITSLYAANTAAELINDLKSGASPGVSRTFTSDGLLASLRQKLLNGAIAIKLSNSTVDSSFNVEKIDADISEIGRVK